MAEFQDYEFNEECFGYILGAGETLAIFIISCKSKEVLTVRQFMPVKEFVENIHVVFDQTFKAVILNVFGITAETGFSNNVEFCEAVREKLKKLKILHYFVSPENVTIASALIVGNINAKLQESICIVMAHAIHYIIYDLCFTKNGYKFISHRYVQVDEKKESLENIKQKIYGSTTPDNTVVASLNPNDPLFLCLKNNASKFKNLVAFDVSDIFRSAVLFVDEMYKWLMDKKYIKYHVLPASARTYYMSTKSVEDANRLRYVDRNEVLPFKESFQLERNAQTAYVTYRAADTTTPKLLQKFSLTSKCHYYCFSVSIDDENFPTVKMEPIIQPQIQMLPELLDISNNSMVPVITFFYNISFICVPKKIGSKCYEFLDEWNGIYGKDLYISFDKEKPKFFEDAFEVYKTNPSFVVYDLLRIISMSPDNIDPNSDWKFTFTKDDNNPVLLEFDTFDGTKKAATPTFLLAMLIKQHVKAITAKIGEKPKKMAFVTISEEGKKEAADKMCAAIKDAFDMLKIEVTLIKDF